MRYHEHHGHRLPLQNLATDQGGNRRPFEWEDGSALHSPPYGAFPQALRVRCLAASDRFRPSIGGLSRGLEAPARVADGGTAGCVREELPQGSVEEAELRHLAGFPLCAAAVHAGGFHPSGNPRPEGCLQNGFQRICVGRLFRRGKPSQSEVLVGHTPTE